MGSEIYLLMFALFITPIPGGIVLITLGNKFHKKPMIIWGSIIVGVMAFCSLTTFAFFTGGAIFLLFGLPLLLLLASAIGFVIAIYYLIDGFMRHIKGRIISGFVILGAIVSFVIVPIILISIFGLPISLM
jgi:hypothetical protein